MIELGEGEGAGTTKAMGGVDWFSPLIATAYRDR